MPPLDPTFLRPIAHRGLHASAEGIVENTRPAFEAAIAKGYGIECDLRPGAGGLPLVFHDDTLERLTEAQGPITDVDAARARKLPFKVKNAGGIPTFEDFLALVAGSVPLLVEIKSEWEAADQRFLAAIAAAARRYRGPLALMSFDPAVMIAMKGLSPDIPRGLVSGTYREPDGSPWWPDRLTDAERAALAGMDALPAIAPSFIAYHVKALPNASASKAKDGFGLPIFTWTVRTEEDRRVASTHSDAPIFEGYLA